MKRTLNWRRVGAASVALVALAIGLMSEPTARKAVIAPAVAAAQSLSAMIGMRSPGARADGALAKAKKLPITTVNGASPPDTNRRRLVPRGPVPATTIDDFIFVPDAPQGGSQIIEDGITDLPGGGGAGVGFTPSFGGIGGGGGSISVGGGGGGVGGGGSGGGSSGGIDIPTPGAVPEPATWFMMIFGFGAIGTMLRRRQRGTARLA